MADRSTVTAREASLQSQQAPIGPPPLASSAPTVPPPGVGVGTSPGFRTAVTPASSRSNAAIPAPPSAPLGSAPKSGVSASFNTLSSPGTPARGELAAYKEQSALMRMLAPFIEDPRPRWLLAFYFLVGVGAGLGAAFGLWGQ